MAVPRQNALGGERAGFTPRTPNFDDMQIGRVANTDHYKEHGKISVVFLDGGEPELVWVINEVDREPLEGDMVVIGYIGGRKDCPYLSGFVRNQSYTSNFIVVEKDLIRLQLPVFGIGKKDSPAYKDASKSLLDDSNLPDRAYVELTPAGITLNFPIKDQTSAHIKITNEGFHFYHPTGDTIMQIKGKMDVIDS